MHTRVCMCVYVLCMCVLCVCIFLLGRIYAMYMYNILLYIHTQSAWRSALKNDEMMFSQMFKVNPFLENIR